MFAFWLAIPAPVKKIIGYAAIIVLALLLFRWYSNSQVEKGIALGREKATAEVTAIKDKEIAAKEKEIQELSSKITEASNKSDAKWDKTVSNMATNNATLAKKLKELDAAKDKNYEKAFTVAASQLDATLRSVSAELDRAASNDTTSQPSQ